METTEKSIVEERIDLTHKALDSIKKYENKVNILEKEMIYERRRGKRGTKIYYLLILNHLRFCAEMHKYNLLLFSISS